MLDPTAVTSASNVDQVSPVLIRRSFSVRLGPYLSQKSFVVAALVLAVLVLLAVLAPLLAPHDPDAQNAGATLVPPSGAHLMGTDEYGRDLFSRILYGGRYTIAGSVLVVCVGCPIGSLLGLIAGYVGGVVDTVIMRFMDLLLAFPGIVLALSITAILGTGLVNAVIAVAIASIPAYARIVEGATVQVRSLPYTEAAEALGANWSHSIMRHILPNVRGSIVVIATTWLGAAALWIAALGFLGVGVVAPTPEWGAILNDSRDYVTLAWWSSFFPGAFLALFIIASNLVGDGLRDILDPIVRSAS